MKIEVLGTRANIEASKPWHSRHAGVLVDGRLLLDLGEREFLDRGAEWAFITHLHPDHAFFVEDDDVDLPLRAFAPEPHPCVEVIDDSVKVDGYEVVPVPTEHSKKVASCGYRVEHDGKRLLYTGDLFWIEKQYRDRLDKLDLVITEASYARKGGLVRQDEDGEPFGHTGVPDLMKLFKPYCDRILFTHLGNWFMNDVPAGRKKIAQLADEHEIDAVIGYDGLEITL